MPHPSHRPAARPSAGNAGGKLPLPHERDQSRGQVASEPDPVIEQAHKDLQAGQVDTDLRATGGLDAARRTRIVDMALRQRRHERGPKP